MPVFGLCKFALKLYFNRVCIIYVLVLDIESNNEKALLLMKQITDAMRKTETTVAKEKVHLL